MDHAEGLVCTLESLDTAAEVEALLAALEERSLDGREAL